MDNITIPYKGLDDFQKLLFAEREIKELKEYYTLVKLIIM